MLATFKRETLGKTLSKSLVLENGLILPISTTSRPTKDGNIAVYIPSKTGIYGLDDRKGLFHMVMVKKVDELGEIYEVISSSIPELRKSLATIKDGVEETASIFKRLWLKVKTLFKHG